MKIDTKLTFSGNKYVFSIPKALVDCEILQKGKSYKIIIEEIENKGSIVKPRPLADLFSYTIFALAVFVFGLLYGAIIAGCAL